MSLQYLVEFEFPHPLTDKFTALLPAQKNCVEQLKKSGSIRFYTLSPDRTKAWIVIAVHYEMELIDIISQLPIAPFVKIDFERLSFQEIACFMSSLSQN